MSMIFAEGTALEGAGSGALIDAIGGLATIVLAIIALAGVASGTIERVHEAGANLLVAGSAVYGQPDPAAAFHALCDAVAVRQP